MATQRSPRNPKRPSSDSGRDPGPSKRQTMADDKIRKLAVIGLLDNENEVSRLEDLVAYQGFDPRAVRKLIEERAADAEGYTRDVGTLIIILATRGTNLSKIAGKSSKEGSDIIRALKNRYKIADPGSPLQRDTVTMSRLGACFPEEVCRFLGSRPEKKYPELDLPENMPKAFYSPSAASLFPKSYGIQTMAMLNLHLEFLIQFDNLIHKNNPTPIDKIKGYQLAAFNSNLIDERNRVRVGVELGWFTINSEDDTMTLLDPITRYYPKQVLATGRVDYHSN